MQQGIPFTLTLNTPAILGENTPIRTMADGRLYISAPVLKSRMRYHLQELINDKQVDGVLERELFGELDLQSSRFVASKFQVSNLISQDAVQPLSASSVLINSQDPSERELQTNEIIPAGAIFSGEIVSDILPESREGTALRLALLAINSIGIRQHLGYGKCSIRLSDNSIETEQLYRLDEPLSIATFNSEEVQVKFQNIDLEIIKYFGKYPEKLRDLPPRKFEELIATLFRNEGFDVELTPITRDGGYDIFAIKNNTIIGTETYLVECKRYSERRSVGIEIVRSLMGVVQINNATKGIISTTTHFSRDAKELAEQYSSRIMLQDYDFLKDWLMRIGVSAAI